MENKSKFQICEKVFAKLKGFPAWPAVIDNVNITNKIVTCDVTFFGTHEIGKKIKEINISSFNEHKTILGKPKRRNALFNEAMKLANKSSLNISDNPSKHRNSLSQNGLSSASFSLDLTGNTLENLSSISN